MMKVLRNVEWLSLEENVKIQSDVKNGIVKVITLVLCTAPFETFKSNASCTVYSHNKENYFCNFVFKVTVWCGVSLAH